MSSPDPSDADIDSIGKSHASDDVPETAAPSRDRDWDNDTIEPSR